MNCKITLCLLVTLLLMPVGASAAEPATVAEAAAMLDLEILPVPEDAEVYSHRRVAELHYARKKPARECFDFVDKQLRELGWEQLPNAQDHGEFVNADYSRDGFLVHVSASPRQAGESSISISHQGNVALGDVPVPANAEKLYDFPAILMYKSPDDVQTTAQACQEELLAAGWQPYGGAGDVRYYRKHAVQVDVNVMSAPAQNNATMISISSHLLSLELPAPDFGDDFRYSDGTSAIDFDCDKNPEEVADYYRQQLGPLGWQATTDEPVEIRWKKFTIFRNAGQEMITIATHDFEGRTRVNLDHQNASEVARDELLALIDAGEKAKYRENKWLPVEVKLPAGATSEKLENWAFRVPTSKDEAFDIAEQIVAAIAADGWQLDKPDKPKPTDDPVIRSYRLTANDRVLHVIALADPKLPSWVAVVGVGGVELEPQQ